MKSRYAKHRNMRDVCIQIIDKAYHGNFWMLKGQWINIANGEPFPMGSSKRLAIETFFIPIETYNEEWKEQTEVFDYEPNVQLELFE